MCWNRSSSMLELSERGQDSWRAVVGDRGRSPGGKPPAFASVYLLWMRKTTPSHERSNMSASCEQTKRRKYQEGKKNILSVPSSNTLVRKSTFMDSATYISHRCAASLCLKPETLPWKRYWRICLVKVSKSFLIYEEDEHTA